MNEAIFSQIDFGPLSEYLENDDITDISYSNGGQIHLKTLSQGIYQIDNPQINNAFIEKYLYKNDRQYAKIRLKENEFTEEEIEFALKTTYDEMD